MAEAISAGVFNAEVVAVTARTALPTATAPVPPVPVPGRGTTSRAGAPTRPLADRIRPTAVRGGGSMNPPTTTTSAKTGPGTPATPAVVAMSDAAAEASITAAAKALGLPTVRQEAARIATAAAKARLSHKVLPGRGAGR